MPDPDAINRKGVIDKLYFVGFASGMVPVWAASAAQARQRGIEHFRVKKSKLMAFIVLTEEEYIT